jgi:hypothetical protein
MKPARISHIPILMVAASLGLGFLAVPAPAAAQATVATRGSFYQYAVKVVCGTVSTFEGAELGHVSGRYQTAINVHNPAGATINFGKHLSIALPFQKAGPRGPFAGGTLAADESLQIECRELMTSLTPGGFLGDCLATDLICIVEGFLIIRSPGELDVVAVYTAAPRGVPGTYYGSGDVSTMHIEVVQPRKMPAAHIGISTAPPSDR